LFGSGTERFWYCVRVVGARSGPTLATTAARPAFTRSRMPAIDGCSANSRPGVLAIATGSRFACARRTLPRAAVYCANSPAVTGITMLFASLPP